MLCTMICEYQVQNVQAQNAEDFVYEIVDGEVKITGYTGDITGDLIIPDYIEEYPVTVIGDNVFNYFGVHTWDINFDWYWEQLTDEERTEWIKNSDWDENEGKGRFREEWQRNYKITQEEYELGKTISKSYVTALAFMPGMFTIYYGDEVGMHGIGNLLSRGTYPWGHEDTELLEFYKRLVKSRKSEEFLRKADVRILRIDENQFVYERYDDDNKIIVITSRVNHKTEIVLPEEYVNAEIVFSIEGCNKHTLAPYGAIVMKK